MCQCTARAERLIAAYHDELQDSDPGKRYAAFTAIHALRQVTGANLGELQACALPHEDQAEACHT